MFVVKDKDHPLFRRVGADLHYIATIPLAKALVGCVIEVNCLRMYTFEKQIICAISQLPNSATSMFQVPTLDGRSLSIPVNDIVQPGYQKRVVGEGMPISKSKDGEKGDLVISFDIVFPTKLEVHQKALIKQALQ